MSGWLLVSFNKGDSVSAFCDRHFDWHLCLHITIFSRRRCKDNNAKEEGGEKVNNKDFSTEGVCLLDIASSGLLFLHLFCKRLHAYQ